MSRGTYRAIHCSLIDDEDFQRLSPNARLTFFICRLCAQAGPAVIFRYYPGLLMAQTGLKAVALEAALTELEAENWILREGVVLWVRNGLRHDPTMRLADRKHMVSVTRALESLPHLSIVLRFCDYYKIPRPFEGPEMTPTGNGGRGSPNPIPKKTEEAEVAESDSERKSPSERVDDPDFEVLWELYPRQVGKGAARRAWVTARRTTAASTILDGLKHQRDELLSREVRFRPHLATWLNQQRWLDREPPPATNGSLLDRRKINDAWKGKTEAREVKL